MTSNMTTWEAEMSPEVNYHFVCVKEPFRHGLCGENGAADGVCCVNFD
jgi:hypothetical protein